MAGVSVVQTVKNLTIMSVRAQTYWQVYDEFNRLAQEMRPTRNGAVKPENFLHRVETLPGYSAFVSDSEKLRHWVRDQRKAALVHKVDARFVSDMPDIVGTRIVPGFDLAKAVAHFREYPSEFAQIIA